MDDLIRQKIQTLLDQHRTMRIATLRPDGWPQVTTVGYANEGFTIYFLCGIDSQKAQNLSRDDRVSLAIDDDPAQVMEITGLSMAARVANPDRSGRSREGDRPADGTLSGTEGHRSVRAKTIRGSPDRADPNRDLAARLFQGIWSHRPRGLLTALLCRDPIS
ncbi:pyridoxamine 5'-phosphate oxidase family protein [Bradyrhizobium sp. CCBAU 11386]|uniref:pyridoxamine 5'-phosphate oxidase family protein n=1 Tax=Bradyrhizobium sp. CCBAU 11386 TaxID=1630837 RepID=UPI002304268C|nr:pyridoxamine 5'-phosphate oxidase family protein [Bradyrhizobium sp. CCBAU 11386]